MQAGVEQAEAETKRVEAKLVGCEAARAQLEAQQLVLLSMAKETNNLLEQSSLGQSSESPSLSRSSLAGDRDGRDRESTVGGVGVDESLRLALREMLVLAASSAACAPGEQLDIEPCEGEVEVSDVEEEVPSRTTSISAADAASTVRRTASREDYEDIKVRSRPRWSKPVVTASR